jgi:hypothetical protein
MDGWGLEYAEPEANRKDLFFKSLKVKTLTMNEIKSRLRSERLEFKLPAQIKSIKLASNSVELTSDQDLKKHLTEGTRLLIQFGDDESKKSSKACGMCGVTKDDSVKLLMCSSCRGVLYCSRECQKAHWPTHKQTCAPKK